MHDIGGDPQSSPSTTFANSEDPNSCKAESRPALPVGDKQQNISDVPEVRPHSLRHIINNPDDPNHRGRIDPLTPGLVVERNIPAGNRRSQRYTSLGDAIDRLRKLRHNLRLFGIAEVQTVRSRHPESLRYKRPFAPPRPRHASPPASDRDRSSAHSPPAPSPIHDRPSLCLKTHAKHPAQPPGSQHRGYPSRASPHPLESKRPPDRPEHPWTPSMTRCTRALAGSLDAHHAGLATRPPARYWSGPSSRTARRPSACRRY